MRLHNGFQLFCFVLLMCDISVCVLKKPRTTQVVPKIDFAVPGAPKCQPITLEACQDVGYNLTAFPNLVGLELEGETRHSLATFRPLVTYGCSSQLQFLLCAFYAPMCSPEVRVLIGPCKPLCLQVKDLCEPVLVGFGYGWPAAFNCNTLPEANDERHMCMEGPGERTRRPVPPLLPRTPPSPVFKCSRYAYPQLYVHINATDRCAPLCSSNVSFSAEDKAFAVIWMAIWASVTFCVSLFTVLSFLLESSNFRYPERAAVHIAVCYVMVSTGYLVRIVVGASGVSCHRDPELGTLLTITEGNLHTTCIVVFLLLYYFSNAAAVWWLMLCASWLLCVWRGCSHDRILRQSTMFHIASWGSAAALTISCLVLRKVEGDELTGTCYAGGASPETVVRWVLVPQFFYLTGGSTLVLLTFARLWRTRTNFLTQGIATDGVGVSVARVGIVAVLYLIPATCVAGASFYEYHKREEWLVDPSVRPNIEIFMLKIFMNMATGIIMGLFLINARVLDSWARAFRRLTPGKKPPPPYLREAAHLKEQYPLKCPPCSHHCKYAKHYYKDSRYPCDRYKLGSETRV